MSELKRNAQTEGQKTNYASKIYIEGNTTYIYLVVKRFFDIVLSFAAGVFLLIPMLIVGILIKIDSPGPILFAQERLGKKGKRFIIYKFRSMRMDAEADGPQWADKDDQRCTKLGKRLRDFRIDELPQLWNIFVGDMSIVGPRPEREVFYDRFEDYIPDFYLRMSVQPGLTGYAQVNGGYDLLPEEKIVYDLEYIRKQSFMMDLKCILYTIMVVFSHDGAR